MNGDLPSNGNIKISLPVYIKLRGLKGTGIWKYYTSDETLANIKLDIKLISNDLTIWYTELASPSAASQDH